MFGLLFLFLTPLCCVRFRPVLRRLASAGRVSGCLFPIADHPKRLDIIVEARVPLLVPPRGYRPLRVQALSFGE